MIVFANYPNNLESSSPDSFYYSFRFHQTKTFDANPKELFEGYEKKLTFSLQTMSTFPVLICKFDSRSH